MRTDRILSPPRSIELKIVVLGSAFVGKTAIINRYCRQAFQDGSPPTVGAGFLTHSLQINGSDVTVMLWDTAGEERFRSVAPSILRGAHALVLVFDLANTISFSELGIYLDMFLNKCHVDPNETPPILLLGNKADLPDRAVAQFDIDNWKEKNRIPFCFDVSAKTGENIEQAIMELLKLVVAIELRQLSVSLQVTKLTNEIEQKPCC
jgi:small GTP-binding protein